MNACQTYKSMGGVK